MAYREKDTKKWTAQWFETNVMGEKKKRRKRGFETKREALEFERSKKLSNERSMDMKLSDFIEIYFSDKQNDLKDRTIKNKRYMMQQHIVPLNTYGHLYPNQQRKIANLLDNENAVNELGEERDEC